MDEQKKRALTRLIIQERLISLTKLLTIPAIFAVIFIAYIHDESTAVTETVTGTVNYWTREQTEKGAGGYIIWVKLTNGYVVAASARKDGRSPDIGEQIKIEKSVTSFGRINYRWRR